MEKIKVFDPCVTMKMRGKEIRYRGMTWETPECGNNQILQYCGPNSRKMLVCTPSIFTVSKKKIVEKYPISKTPKGEVGDSRSTRSMCLCCSKDLNKLIICSAEYFQKENQFQNTVICGGDRRF